MDKKKIRILFLDDDDELEIVNILKDEGYDVAHWHDVESLESMSDGRYQIIFYDVRGVGEKLKGNGLDVLQYVATHNPLVFNVVFSAKPFSGRENEITRKYANKVLMKDCTAYEVMGVIDSYVTSMSKEQIVAELGKYVKLGFFEKRNILAGRELNEKQISKIISRTKLANEYVGLAANVTKLAAGLVAVLSI